SKGNVAEIKEALTQKKIVQKKFGGIISSATHAISGKGKPWGRFTVEDYTDSLEITLFGEQYLGVQNYMNEGMFVYVDIATGPPPKWKLEKDSNADFEFKSVKLSLLSEVLEKNCKMVEVSLSTSQLKEPFISDLEKILNSHPGHHSFVIYLRDKETDFNIRLKSNKYKVNCVTLVDELEKQKIDFILK
ncbi:MAG: hypothetical protein RBS19_10140, partial [Bacteroidales bacterium]|nr:hypothetical protein [Bacteroidales bacterium]